MTNCSTHSTSLYTTTLYLNYIQLVHTGSSDYCWALTTVITHCVRCRALSFMSWMAELSLAMYFVLRPSSYWWRSCNFIQYSRMRLIAFLCCDLWNTFLRLYAYIRCHTSSSKEPWWKWNVASSQVHSFEIRLSQNQLICFNVEEEMSKEQQQIRDKLHRKVQ